MSSCKDIQGRNSTVFLREDMFAEIIIAYFNLFVNIKMNRS